MLTLHDVTAPRRRPPSAAAPSLPATAVLSAAGISERALHVPSVMERSDRMRLDEALAALDDDALRTLHGLTDATIALLDRGAAAYGDLERGLRLLEDRMAERGLLRRRAGRRPDPLCTARARLKELVTPLWSDNVAAMHRLLEAASTALRGIVADADASPEEIAVAARSAVEAARTAPGAFGRVRKQVRGRGPQPEWEAIATALTETLTLAARRSESEAA